MLWMNGTGELGEIKHNARDHDGKCDDKHDKFCHRVHERILTEELDRFIASELTCQRLSTDIVLGRSAASP